MSIWASLGLCAIKVPLVAFVHFHHVRAALIDLL